MQRRQPNCLRIFAFLTESTDYQPPVWRQAAGPTVFAPVPMDTWIGAEQAWMVSFRVRNLDPMITQLRGSGCRRHRSQAYSNGRFARLHDPDGNPIELWEPAGK